MHLEGQHISCRHGTNEHLAKWPLLKFVSEARTWNLRCYRLGKRRITASSRSNGRFVAPRIRIRWLSLDLRPSQAAINSLRILLVASCSNAPPLAPSKLSTYNNQTVSCQEIMKKPPYVEYLNHAQFQPK